MVENEISLSKTSFWLPTGSPGLEGQCGILWQCSLKMFCKLFLHYELCCLLLQKASLQNVLLPHASCKCLSQEIFDLLAIESPMVSQKLGFIQNNRESLGTKLTENSTDREEEIHFLVIFSLSSNFCPNWMNSKTAYKKNWCILQDGSSL